MTALPPFCRSGFSREHADMRRPIMSISGVQTATVRSAPERARRRTGPAWIIGCMFAAEAAPTEHVAGEGAA